MLACAGSMFFLSGERGCLQSPDLQCMLSFRRLVCNSWFGVEGMGSVEDTVVYPARLKIVKQDGRPVHRTSERGDEPSIGIQWDVWCGHPHCRRVFGRLLRVISRFPTCRLE